MKQIIKKLARKGVNVSLTQGKKILKNSPRTTSFLRDTLLNYINIEAAAVTNNKHQIWMLQNYPDGIDQLKQRHESLSFEYRPLISVLVPTYNTDINFLEDCIDSVQAQTYDNWELILVDDNSPNNNVRDKIIKYSKSDNRINYHFRKKNGHISAATNDALKIAKGDYIALLDHDDILWPNALYENVKALNSDKNIDFLYSDEDKITLNRWEHRDLFLKPDWNPEFLQSVNYITHFSVIRTSVVKNVGGFRSEYDGAQDWDLFLRVSNFSKNIHHIAKVLYSWRISPTSAASGIEAKPYAIERQRNAIQNSLIQKGDTEARVVQGLGPDYWTVEYPIINNPKISIVIPTKDQFFLVKKCIESIIAKTTYKNYEIILVDTGSVDKNVLNWYKKINKNKNVKVINFHESPFNYSRSCNYGVKESKGEYILLLNNDMELLTSNWIEILLSDAQRDDIGAVGCKLYYPDKIHLQHAGIGIGLNKTAANLLSKISIHNMTLIQSLYANTRHEMTAVTAACLMIKRSKFDDVGGFEEKFRITYNDVDLCLKLKEAGYRNIYNPHAELIHHESISVGLPTILKETKNDNNNSRDEEELIKTTMMLQNRWREYINHDPNINDLVDKSNAFLEPLMKDSFTR
jgi:GT2 family glycosyltransferase